MIAADWDLPDGFTTELRRDGSIALYRQRVLVGELPMLTPGAAVRAWADAYDRGFMAGEKSGIRQLVARLRDWLKSEAT